MRTWVQRLAGIAVVLTMLAAGSWAQSDQGAGQDMKNAGSATKSAGQDVGQAGKKTARTTKKATKKGTHKAAHKTRKGAANVENKTAPPQ